MRLVLIDGNAILHRAFHALPPLTTTKGELVNAVYGFLSMIIRVISDLSPDYLIVCFDRPKPTFRQTIFIGYQARRPKMDEGLSSQIEKVHDLVKSLNIPIYELDGFEADDLLGTLSLQAKKKKNAEVIIVTGDRDILQLVDDKVKVYMPTKGLSEGKIYNSADVEEKFEVKPEQFIDYKAMLGDSSDNYSGVDGIGPKTASVLLKKFKNLDDIYHHLSLLDLKIKERLEKGKDSAYLARMLATIERKAPIKLEWDKAKLDNLATPEAVELINSLEFHSLLKRLPGYKAEEKEDKGSKKKKEPDKNQLGFF